MIYLEGLMHKKINIWVALLVIAVIAACAAYAISARAYYASWYIGGMITSYIPGCTMATPAPGCSGVPCPCRQCGCVCAPCTPPPPQWSEIIFTPYGGSRTNYVCPPIGFRYSNSLPAPSKYILGWGQGVYAPVQISISR